MSLQKVPIETLAAGDDVYAIDPESGLVSIRKPAGELEPGDQIRAGDSLLTVAGASPVREQSTVYNFEVSEDHTYRVGELGAWVHNASYPDAFEIAQAGGKHAGFLKNYVGRSPAEIQRGIASLQRQVAEHRAKIANPEKFIEGWRSSTPGSRRRW